MPGINAANDVVFNERGAIEHLDTKNDNDMPKLAPSVDVHDEKNAEFATDLNHVAQLGFENAAELEKKVVRALDTWMMPQLWILYMFNYLNRHVSPFTSPLLTNLSPCTILLLAFLSLRTTQSLLTTI
jgi:hypothetical protein